jgi:hypothetical protein
LAQGYTDDEHVIASAQKHVSICPDEQHNTQPEVSGEPSS